MSSFLPACSKKSDDTGAADTDKVKQMLGGKWVFVSYTRNHHTADKDNISTTPASSGDYVTFGSDGKLQLRLLGYDDVSTYSVLAAGKLIFYGPDVFDIKTLSATELRLYKKDVISTKDYIEETYVFTK